MSAAFECRVKHDPSLIPTMTWLKDSGELPDDERYKDLEHQDYEINLIHVNTVKKNKKKPQRKTHHPSVTLCCQVCGGLGQSDHQRRDRRR